VGKTREKGKLVIPYENGKTTRKFRHQLGKGEKRVPRPGAGLGTFLTSRKKKKGKALVRTREGKPMNSCHHPAKEKRRIHQYGVTRTGGQGEKGGEEVHTSFRRKEERTKRVLRQGESATPTVSVRELKGRLARGEGGGKSTVVLHLSLKEKERGGQLRRLITLGKRKSGTPSPHAASEFGALRRNKRKAPLKKGGKKKNEIHNFRPATHKKQKHDTRRLAPERPKALFIAHQKKKRKRDGHDRGRKKKKGRGEKREIRFAALGGGKGWRGVVISAQARKR